jgi:hypothetical protein
VPPFALLHRNSALGGALGRENSVVSGTVNPIDHFFMLILVIVQPIYGENREEPWLTQY